MKAFSNLSKVKSQNVPSFDATLRDFSGGLKVIENQNALTSRFSVVQKNLLAEEDNSMSIRFGTNQFGDTIAGNTLNATYFQNHLIVMKDTGDIWKVDAAGAETLIGTALWSTGLDLVDFSDYRGELVLTNGEDKPLLIKADLTVDYLEDIPTGSNVFTPITKFVTTVSNYTVMAGFNDTDEIFISSTGTSGTWPGDTAPNDSISIRVGAYTGKSGKDIKAAASFRNFLLIFFSDSLVVFELGIFEGAVHKPRFVDAFNDLGVLNHKCLFSTDSDLFFATKNGIYSAQKNLFGGTLESTLITENLGTEYVKATANSTLTDLTSFLVNDPLSKTIILSVRQETGAPKVFAATYRKEFSKFAWSVFTGWNFTCAALTKANRLMFFETTNTWQYGNNVFTGENYTADFITTLSEGVDIEFDWELPWTDANNRNITKLLKLISLDTLGDSQFTVECFVDGFYKDITGIIYDPALSMEFVAGETGGYGTPSEGYGGGRRANDERFFGMPLKFKTIKLRFFGATKKALRISSISMVYHKGNYKR